jgi:hypothetical protein
LNLETQPDNNSLNESKPIKCFIRGCEGEGKHILKVVHVNLWGQFCDDCAKSVIKEGLVHHTDSIHLGIGQGRIFEKEDTESHLEGACQ